MKKEENSNKNKKEKLPSEKESRSSINTDPFGSYTGVDTENKYDIPVQDVDDL